MPEEVVQIIWMCFLGFMGIEWGAFRKFSRDFIDRYSWRTDRNLLVIISDDWGSYRLRGSKDREELTKIGLNLNTSVYNQYDGIESSGDLVAMYEVLTSVKDSLGSNAKITAMVNVANPDFHAIRLSGYKEYFYRPIDQSGYDYMDDLIELYLEGVRYGVFHPEYHGREHLNIRFWMSILSNCKSKARAAFDYEFYGLDPRDIEVSKGRDFMTAYDPYYPKEGEKYVDEFSDGVEIFRRIFGYDPLYFAPSGLIYCKDVMVAAARSNIFILDAPRIASIYSSLGRMKQLSILGKRNSYGQTWINRNAVFEPCANNSAVSDCLASIEYAFDRGKPVIVSSHRINYTSRVSVKFRDTNLDMLQSLLNQIVKKWPKVEFVTIGDLVSEINRT